MKSNNLHHGETIKKIVKERGLADDEFAGMLFITRNGVLDIYKREKVKRKRLIEICQKLNIDISIFGEDILAQEDISIDKEELLLKLLEAKDEQIKLLKEKIAFLEGTK